MRHTGINHSPTIFLVLFRRLTPCAKTRLFSGLVDDHQIVIDGLLALLQGDERFRIGFATTDPTTVLQLLRKTPVDILLTDVAMPDLPGNELARLVRAAFRIPDPGFVHERPGRPGQ